MRLAEGHAFPLVSEPKITAARVRNVIHQPNLDDILKEHVAKGIPLKCEFSADDLDTLVRTYPKDDVTKQVSYMLTKLFEDSEVFYEAGPTFRLADSKCVFYTRINRAFVY